VLGDYFAASETVRQAGENVIGKANSYMPR
jgi:hypothetical protein